MNDAQSAPVKYASVSGAWPETVPPISYREAHELVRRLHRKFLSKLTVPVKTTTGNWLTWRRDGVFSVTLERREHGFVVRDAGWRDIVHLMSHYVHRRKRPTHKPHAATHAFLEKEMIEHVVRSGRLEGKLKRPEKAPEPEPTATE